MSETDPKDEMAGDMNICYVRVKNWKGTTLKKTVYRIFLGCVQLTPP